MEEKKKPKTKRASKRSKTKYPGLSKALYSKIKQEFFDIDYVAQLSEEEKEWLNHFMNGDLGANTKDNPVFEDYEEKRKCWKKNNDRNNDVYSVMRATGRLTDAAIMPTEVVDFESELIDYIDEGLKIKKISEEL